MLLFVLPNVLWYYCVSMSLSWFIYRRSKESAFAFLLFTLSRVATDNEFFDFLVRLVKVIVDYNLIMRRLPTICEFHLDLGLV